MTTKNKISLGLPAIFSGIMLCFSANAVAQSNYKESSNSFAFYTQTGNLKDLESAKKFIDAAYVTRRDSSNTRVNVLRSMIYSSMAYADSTRSIKNPKDPIDIAYDAVAKLRPRELQEFASEMKYVKQNLAASHIYNANKALAQQNYAGAYESYARVKKLNIANYDVTYNLALLAVQTGQFNTAVEYYNQIIKQEKATAEHYLELAHVYQELGNKQGVLNTLQTARTKFPQNKAVLMHLIEEFAQNTEYKAIVPIVDEAIKYEPQNIDLNYLAGYSNESVGNLDVAKRYYQQVLQLNGNNYESNLALGLIYLNDFLRDENNNEAQYNAQNLLLKANEIRPYDVNALKSLSLYYEKSGDLAQLDRVKLLLNQLSNN